VAFYLAAAIEEKGRFDPSSPFCRRGITTVLTREGEIVWIKQVE